MTKSIEVDAPQQWDCHLGDLAFHLSAPASWAAAQRGYLAGYLPGRPGDRDDLSAYELDIRLDDAGLRRLNRQPVTAPGCRQLEIVPGVVLREACDEPGLRSYTVLTDGLEGQAGAYAVSIRGRSIVLYLNQNAVRCQSYPLRLMREAMIRTYENIGAAVFHAAGVDLAGYGIMICGPRSSGKTTTLTAMLQRRQAGLLSNDRLILQHDGRLLAVPLPVPVARGTLDATPELGAALLGSSRPQPSRQRLPAVFGTVTKAELSAREYASALGVRLSPASTLRAILATRLTDTTEPPQVRRLSRDEAQLLLQATCFTPRDEFWLKPWLVPRAKPDHVLSRNASRLIRRAALSVPCFELRYGVRNPRSRLADALTALLEDIR
jgi:hypothetical protein